MKALYDMSAECLECGTLTPLIPKPNLDLLLKGRLRCAGCKRILRNP